MFCFFTDRVKYLEYIIKPKSLTIVETNFKSFNQQQHSRNNINLHSFLELCNLYWRPLPNYTSIAAPLKMFLYKDQPKNLLSQDSNKIQAFHKLIQTISSMPVHALSHCDVPFVIDTDASVHNVGAARLQTYTDVER